MRNLRILAALGLAAAAGAASADDVTATVFGVSDYDFRGTSQNARDPAFQFTGDYVGENGLAVGIFGSNVDFGPTLNADFEIDLYGGFSGKINEKLGWSTGVTYYAYPGETDLNYVEIYGGLSYDYVSAKVWYSNKFLGDFGEDLARSTSGDDDTSAFYIEGNATIPLPQNFSILLHAGLSTGDYWDNAIGDDVVDYSVGVGYVAGKFNLALKFIGNDTGDVAEIDTDVNSQEDRVLFTVQTTFPWKSE
jgi:uncharacterized protein (TIGR02001 family)